MLEPDDQGGDHRGRDEQAPYPLPSPARCAAQEIQGLRRDTDGRGRRASRRHPGRRTQADRITRLRGGRVDPHPTARYLIPDTSIPRRFFHTRDVMRARDRRGVLERCRPGAGHRAKCRDRATWHGVAARSLFGR